MRRKKTPEPSFEQAVHEALEKYANDPKFRAEVHNVSELYAKFLNAGGRSNIPMSDVVPDSAARNMIKFIADEVMPKDADPRDALVNGILIGIYLSEVGRAVFLTRDRKKKKEPEIPPVIIMGDLSGKRTFGEC